MTDFFPIEIVQKITTKYGSRCQNFEKEYLPTRQNRTLFTNSRSRNRDTTSKNTALDRQPVTFSQNLDVFLKYTTETESLLCLALNDTPGSIGRNGFSSQTYAEERRTQLPKIPRWIKNRLSSQNLGTILKYTEEIKPHPGLSLQGRSWTNRASTTTSQMRSKTNS